jgi:peptide chain release factor 2
LRASRAECSCSRSIFDLDGKREQVELLERQTLSPNFWDDQHEAKRVQRQLGQLQDLIGVWQKHFSDLEDADMLLDMALEEDDKDILS